MKLKRDGVAPKECMGVANVKLILNRVILSAIVFIITVDLAPFLERFLLDLNFVNCEIDLLNVRILYDSMKFYIYYIKVC